MSANLALGIIAVVMVSFLVLGILLAIAVWRTLSTSMRLAQRVEQELSPLVFDLRIIVNDMKRAGESTQQQVRRMENTVHYVSSSVMDATDAMLAPVQRFRTWTRAASTGMRYFFRRS